MPRRKALRDKEIAWRQKPGHSGSFHERYKGIQPLQNCHKIIRPAIGCRGRTWAGKLGCSPGRELPALVAQAALLVTLSATWELMNSIFTAFVWDPALPSPPLNYCHSFLTLLSYSHPQTPHAAARVIFLNVCQTMSVSRFRPFIDFLLRTSDKAQVLICLT